MKNLEPPAPQITRFQKRLLILGLVLLIAASALSVLV